MKCLYLLLSVFILSSCTNADSFNKEPTSEDVIVTDYYAQILVQENVTVDFICFYDIELSYLTISNGKEKIVLDEFYEDGDTVIYPLHVFDAELRLFQNEVGWEGYWVKNYVDNYRAPLSILPLVSNSNNCGAASKVVNGKYEMTFTMEDKERKALAIFESVGDSIFGTVMTATGDYRFLNGRIDCDQFSLFTFNGESAYRFDGEILNDSTLIGDFYSGISRHETWQAIKNDSFLLDDPTQIGSSLQYADPVSFSAMNMEGKLADLSAEKYENRPVIIQILGTWCPNCMDEAAFFNEWMQAHPDAGVEIVGLAFELKDDFEYAKNRILKFKEKYNLGYEILFAGIKSRENVQSFFPFLDGVIAYPTTIYLNGRHEVVKIYTGFSGPASGEYYEQFKVDFDEVIQKISL